MNNPAKREMPANRAILSFDCSANSSGPKKFHSAKKRQSHAQLETCTQLGYSPNIGHYEFADVVNQADKARYHAANPSGTDPLALPVLEGFPAERFAMKVKEMDDAKHETHSNRSSPGRRWPLADRRRVR